MDLIDKTTNDVRQHYECTHRELSALCLANLESLLRIALADPDEHIRELGIEAHLLELMNGYLDLFDRINRARKLD